MRKKTEQNYISLTKYLGLAHLSQSSPFVKNLFYITMLVIIKIFKEINSKGEIAEGKINLNRGGFKYNEYLQV